MARGTLTVLGIETSCDETAAAIVRRAEDGAAAILSNRVRGQTADHAPFGGVVPEIAARAHVERLDGQIAAALSDAGLGWEALDAVAATVGPGLVGGLVVGAVTGRAVAFARGLPFVPVNHLEGHVLTARLTDGVAFPYLALLASGGHTQFVAADGVGRYRRLGSTIDDALGEAFDKVAKLLGLPQPGGPEVERAARDGDPRRFALPRPLKGDPSANFSLSGLKTAVRQTAERAGALDRRTVADIAASFQAAAVDAVADRTARAIALMPEATALVVAGGVAANAAIRARLAGLAAETGLAFVAPPVALCGDNAAMIAFAAAERMAAGLADDPALPVRSRWPLDADAAPLVGSGRRGAKA